MACSTASSVSHRNFETAPTNLRSGSGSAAPGSSCRRTTLSSTAWQPRFEWANGCGLYEAAAVATFGQAADYFLVSHAHPHGHVVVTHEVPANSRMKIKIPDVCDGMGVQWTTPFEMLRATGARFVVAP